MPSVFTHAVVGATLGACLAKPAAGRWLIAAAAAVAVLPDADVAGLMVGFHLDHPIGHRGLSHSLPFAALVAGLVSLAVWRVRGGQSLGAVWWCLFLATASHGVLDAFTNGGRGVAFWAPVSDARWHAPVTPIEVSPIGVREVFSARGVEILTNEVRWVWLPSLAVAFLVRRRQTRVETPVCQ
jgi:inner membrane protein